MERPNEQQVQDACAILKANKRIYGLSGAEGSDRRAVYSILAALGGPGTIADEFVSALEEAPKAKKPSINPDDAATDAPEPWFAVTPIESEEGNAFLAVVKENEYGIPVDTIFRTVGDPEGEWFAVEQSEDTGGMVITIIAENDYDLPVGNVYAYFAEDDAEEDEATVLTKSAFDAMNKEELVKAYGESYGLTMDMNRDEMWDKVKPASGDEASSD